MLYALYPHPFLHPLHPLLEKEFTLSPANKKLLPPPLLNSCCLTVYVFACHIYCISSVGFHVLGKLNCVYLDLSNHKYGTHIKPGVGFMKVRL